LGRPSQTSNTVGKGPIWANRGKIRPVAATAAIPTEDLGPQQGPSGQARARRATRTHMARGERGIGSGPGFMLINRERDDWRQAGRRPRLPRGVVRPLFASRARSRKRIAKVARESKPGQIRPIRPTPRAGCGAGRPRETLGVPYGRYRYEWNRKADGDIRKCSGGGPAAESWRPTVE